MTHSLSLGCLWLNAQHSNHYTIAPTQFYQWRCFFRSCVSFPFILTSEHPRQANRMFITSIIIRPVGPWEPFLYKTIDESPVWGPYAFARAGSEKAVRPYYISVRPRVLKFKQFCSQAAQAHYQITGTWPLLYERYYVTKIQFIKVCMGMQRFRFKT